MLKRLWAARCSSPHSPPPATQVAGPQGQQPADVGTQDAVHQVLLEQPDLVEHIAQLLPAADLASAARLLPLFAQVRDNPCH